MHGLLPRVVFVLQIIEYLETLRLFGNPNGGNIDRDGCIRLE